MDWKRVLEVIYLRVPIMCHRVTLHEFITSSDLDLRFEGFIARFTYLVFVCGILSMVLRSSTCFIKNAIEPVLHEPLMPFGATVCCIV